MWSRRPCSGWKTPSRDNETPCKTTNTLALLYFHPKDSAEEDARRRQRGALERGELDGQQGHQGGHQERNRARGKLSDRYIQFHVDSMSLSCRSLAGFRSVSLCRYNFFGRVIPSGVTVSSDGVSGYQSAQGCVVVTVAVVIAVRHEDAPPSIFFCQSPLSRSRADEPTCLVTMLPHDTNPAPCLVLTIVTHDTNLAPCLVLTVLTRDTHLAPVGCRHSLLTQPKGGVPEPRAVGDRRGAEIRRKSEGEAQGELSSSRRAITGMCVHPYVSMRIVGYALSSLRLYGSVVSILCAPLAVGRSGKNDAEEHLLPRACIFGRVYGDTYSPRTCSRIATMAKSLF